MLLPGVLASALLLVVAGASSREYLLLVRSTHRRQLAPNGLIRAGRRYWSFLLSKALAVPAWPHLVELVLGLHRTPTATTYRTREWACGPASLWRYPSAAPGGSPVLLVHSLVTRPSVLDLMPGLSLVEALLSAGHDVWLLDWGVMTAGEASWGLSEYGAVLWQAEQVVAARAGRAVHVVGYCAGGTVAVAVHAAHGHARLASLTLIAAALDTRAAGGLMVLLRSRAVAPGLVLDGDGLVPAAVVREAFHALRPQAVKTMRRVVAARHDAFLRTAAGAMGRWTWEQTPLPGAVLFDVVDLARNNSIIDKTLQMGGIPTDLDRLAGLPMLLVTTVRDHIVPPASTSALKSVPGIDVEELQCASGHVAMLAGREAHRVLYPGLVRWPAERG